MKQKTSVAEPHHFWKPDPGPHQSKKPRALEAHNGATEAHPGSVEAHSGAVKAHPGAVEGLQASDADSHPSDEELNSHKKRRVCINVNSRI
jgi:hypothetical protein